MKTWNSTAEEVVNEVVELLKTTNLTLRQIASKVKISHPTVCKISRDKLGYKSHYDRIQRLKASNVPRHTSHGYTMVSIPAWWEGGAEGVGIQYVREHQLIFCKANGLTKVPDGFVIHHINENRSDNRLENLQLMSRSDHMRHHRLSK